MPRMREARLVAAQINGHAVELDGIAAAVGDGIALTGDEGSVAMTIAGVLMLGLVFNLLNIGNGLGCIRLSANWQPVIRGVVPAAGIVQQARELKQRGKKRVAAANRGRGGIPG